jgi:hypothetical protein
MFGIGISNLAPGKLSLATTLSAIREDLEMQTKRNGQFARESHTTLGLYTSTSYYLYGIVYVPDKTESQHVMLKLA